MEIQGPSGTHVLEVEEGETILQNALDNGIELSHDCKMGVCMTCPAKLVSSSTVLCCPFLHLLTTRRCMT